MVAQGLPSPGGKSRVLLPLRARETENFFLWASCSNRSFEIGLTSCGQSDNLNLVFGSNWNPFYPPDSSMYEIKVKGDFAAAHNLRDVGGKCESLHGHNFTVEVAVESDGLDELGMVMDFRLLKAKTRAILDNLDHRYLNEPPFPGNQPLIGKPRCLYLCRDRPPGRPRVQTSQLGFGLGIRDFAGDVPQAGKMIDIQSQRDHRRVGINKVGVKNIEYPITVLDKKNRVQHTVGKVNMYVNLPHRFKGTHMSRFVEILNKYKGDIAIGHTRYSTTGSSRAPNIQPIIVGKDSNTIAVAHNGNLVNAVVASIHTRHQPLVDESFDFLGGIHLERPLQNRPGQVRG
jgi:queuosine biosynthesis protein QueD